MSKNCPPCHVHVPHQCNEHEMIVKSMHSGLKSLLYVYILSVESQKIMEVFHCTIDLHGVEICHGMVAKNDVLSFTAKFNVELFSVSINLFHICF